jgi:hypothetical protein
MAGQYALSDLVVYSPETFYRLLERYHASIWPLHVVVVAVAIGAVRAALRRGENDLRFLLAALAGAWGLVAWRYFGSALATLHWAAPLFAGSWALEAVGLLCAATLSPRRAGADRTPWRWTALFVALFAVVVPLFEGLARARLRAVSFVGLTPETTAAVTLVVLLLGAPGHRRWLRGVLAIVPIAWLTFGLLEQAGWDGAEAALAAFMACGVLALFAVAAVRCGVVARRARLPQNPPRE